MVRVRIPGGCGVDTVREVVEAAVADAAPDTAGVVFDRAPAAPTLLQIGVRRAVTPERCRRFLREPVGPAAGAVRAVRDAGGRPSTRTSSSPRSGGCCAPARRAGCCSASPGLRYRRVPDRYLADPGFALSDAQWDALQVPVGMAFFLVNSAPGGGRRVLPEPGGRDRERAAAGGVGGRGGGVRARRALEPDVEALLVRRGTPGRGDRAEALLVPVDACYRLVGLVRRHWKGFDGGTEAWAAIDAFFDDLRERARAVSAGRSGGRHAEVRVHRRPARALRRRAVGASSTCGSSADVPVHTVALRTQIRIEPRRRRYTAPEDGAARPTCSASRRGGARR